MQRLLWLFQKDEWMRWGMILHILLMSSLIMMVLVYVWQLPPEIPWLYSRLSGETRLVGRYWFGITALLSLGLASLTTSALVWYRLATVLEQYILLWSGVLQLLLVLLAQIQVVRLVL